MPDTVTGSLYDYPQYYDLVYGSDWKAEFDFLLTCTDQFLAKKAKHFYEPACGTGRLMIRLAKAGFQVSGCDLNEKAVRYCNQRLARAGFDETAVVADMTQHVARPKANVAFNMINSFRHLDSEAAAEAHLRCVANGLPPGGLYVLGIHLTPADGQPECEGESWPARRGHLAVLSTLWLIERNLHRRIERFGMSYDVYTPTRQFRLEDEVVFRTYTLRQFQSLLARVGLFEVAAVSDFSYDFNADFVLDDLTEDAVFVLRRL